MMNICLSSSFGCCCLRNKPEVVCFSLPFFSIIFLEFVIAVFYCCPWSRLERASTHTCEDGNTFISRKSCDSADSLLRRWSAADSPARTRALDSGKMVWHGCQSISMIAPVDEAPPNTTGSNGLSYMQRQKLAHSLSLLFWMKTRWFGTPSNEFWREAREKPKSFSMLSDSNTNVNSMINRRVSLFYRFPLRAFHHMVCLFIWYDVCVVCPGTSELVGQHSSCKKKAVI